MKRPKRPKDKTAAARKRRQRANQVGRRLSATLTDPQAIGVLVRLIADCGTERAAIEQSLTSYEL